MTCSSVPKNVLGRTGLHIPNLGFGCTPLGHPAFSSFRAERLVAFALDMGISYIDVAPNYGDAELKLRNILRHRRPEIVLASKVEPDRPSRRGVVAQIENSLQRLGTEYLDVAHIHSLGDHDPTILTAPDGTLPGLCDARDRGLIRFIGVSGHHRVDRFVPLLESGQIDVVMIPLNFVDRNVYDFERTVLSVARKHNIAVVAMKVLGGAFHQVGPRSVARLSQYRSLALRYSLHLPGVAVAVVGFTSRQQIREAIEVAKINQPLTNRERGKLLVEGRILSEHLGARFGPPGEA